jgi:outer membrane protein assembly factor BamD (BamD/ComL family)
VGAPRVPGAGGSSLSEQVQSLDRARVALGSGNAGAALVEIAHYRKAWPKGVFLTEASVLEIEALAKRGEHSLAAARAQAFVTAHPDSPQAERLRALSSGPASE